MGEGDSKYSANHKIGTSDIIAQLNGRQCRWTAFFTNVFSVVNESHGRSDGS